MGTVVTKLTFVGEPRTNDKAVNIATLAEEIKVQSIKGITLWEDAEQKVALAFVRGIEVNGQPKSLIVECTKETVKAGIFKSGLFVPNRLGKKAGKGVDTLITA